MGTDTDMVWIEAGEFVMGADGEYPEEAPAHRVAVAGFWIDRYAVTNRQFTAFAAETGHRTVAERAPDPAEYPGADPALLVAGSAVFTPPTHRVDMRDAYQWWSYLPGASWRHPRGKGSDLTGLEDHPVVHLAWADVAAYAAWAGKSLPTEAQWEYAARGGLDGTEYAWGAELTPGGVHMANVWQGEFPVLNLAADGYEWTAPVGSFPPNGYGLHDMIGNVWEWTRDWYAPHTAPVHGCCAPSGDGARRVIKGGSFLCAPNYCRRYRPAARMGQAVDTSTCHLGFRCVAAAG